MAEYRIGPWSLAALFVTFFAGYNSISGYEPEIDRRRTSGYEKPRPTVKEMILHFEGTGLFGAPHRLYPIASRRVHV